jgi:hypothetical protein
MMFRSVAGDVAYPYLLCEMGLKSADTDGAA